MTRTALTLVACAALSGCHVGAVSRWSDPNYPISGPSSGDRQTSEIGGGAGGAVAEIDGAALVRVANRRLQAVLPRNQLGASPRLDGDWIYFRDGDRLLRRAIAGRPSKAEEVTTVAALRGFEVRGGAALLAAGDGVYFKEGSEAPRRLWRGEALAIAYEPERRQAWIAARRPLPVIEALDLDSGEPTLRVPLPLELDSPDLVLVVSSPRIAAYVPGEPIARTLLIDPEARRAGLLAEKLPPSYRPRNPALKSRALALEPLVLEPPGRLQGERMSLPVMRESFVGRIGALPGGEFVLIDNRPELDRLTISRVDARFGLSLISVPDDCPRGVDALGWDEAGAYMIADGRSLSIAKDEAREVHLSGWGPATRRGFNRGLNGLLVVAEIGVGFPTNAAFAGFIAPFGALATVFGGGPYAVRIALAPFWFPITRTFNADF